jgi:excinuclease UvrABC nuclease subunit
MPLNNTQEYGFDAYTLSTVNEVGAVYALVKPMANKPGWYTVLYVGRTDNLRRRLAEHYNNPPIAGVTHFFAEVISTERQRVQREAELIAEFQPPGNTVGRR